MKRLLPIAITLAILGLAAWALYRQLSGVDPAAVLRAMLTMPPWTLVAAALLLMVSFLAYGVIEWCSAIHAGVPMSAARSLVLALAAQGISLSTGKGLLVAGLIRIRLFGRWGHGMTSALLATAAVFVLGNLGLAAIGGAVAAAFGPWYWWPRLAGAAGGAALIAAAVAWSRSQCAWTILGRRIEAPRPQPLIRGILAGMIEKAACAAIAGVFLAGHGLELPQTMAVVLVALLAARASQVPGGLGVLEAGTFALWPTPLDDAGRASLLAGMLLFRCYYFLIPLLIGLPLMAWFGYRPGGDVAAVVRTT